MYVFPLKPNRIEEGEVSMETEVLKSKTNNEQRIGHLGQAKETYSLSLDAIPVFGSVDTLFQEQHKIGDDLYNLPNFMWFFTRIARAQMNSFILKAYPPLIPNDITVRLSSDKFKKKMINRYFCNLTVEVETC